MKHRVICGGCGKTERIEAKRGTNIHEKQGWYYYGKLNVNACQTDRFFWKPKDPEKGILGELEKVKNPCYDPSVKPKNVELWFCKECDEKEEIKRK